MREVPTWDEETVGVQREALTCTYDETPKRTAATSCRCYATTRFVSTAAENIVLKCNSPPTGGVKPNSDYLRCLHGNFR